MNPSDCRDLFGLDPRLVVWIVAELHLMFGAFVLGVPIFTVILELVGLVGIRTGDRRFDRLSQEFTMPKKTLTSAALRGIPLWRIKDQLFVYRPRRACFSASLASTRSWL